MVCVNLSQADLAVMEMTLMECILIFALWSDGSRDALKLHSEKFFSDRKTCERIGHEMVDAMARPDHGFRVTSKCKRVES